MKVPYTALMASAALAAPALVERQSAPCTAPVTLTGNPFTGRTLSPGKTYPPKVVAAAAAISDPTLKAQALKVAEVGTFVWMDTRAKIATLEENIRDTACNQITGVVIYNLPGRDCAAKASNGELPVGAINVYKKEYIDPIVAIFKKYPKNAFVLVIEPDSLPNLVTNINLATCQASAAGYREGVAYAIKSLNLPNIAMYIDAGHGGWLGWNDNLAPGAKELANAYKAAGSPKSVRGVASNVAGWNAVSKVPGEFENTPDGKYNKAHDEQRYAQVFGAALSAAGHPSQFIIDTARNARQGLRVEWGHWCNVIGAGFGVRPTAATNIAGVDAFVWVKPGGESDGTSDTTAVRYDSFCGHTDAFKPSPEAGQWNQAYFEALLKNASPQF